MRRAAPAARARAAPHLTRRLALAAALALLASGCRTPQAALPAGAPSPRPKVRFLLTFDDGPSPSPTDNPTATVLATLADNPVQRGIKAVFFVQSRWPGAGGAPAGQALLRREAALGHLLGLHSGSERGHLDHPGLGDAELEATLRAGAEDLAAAGAPPLTLVRPPSWRFDARTLAAYRRAGLEMLLTDLSARDGSLVLFQAHPTRGGRMPWELRCLKERVARGSIPALDGVHPVVVTFHDPNRYTAQHLATYLATLLRSARAAGLDVAEPPFYASAREAGLAAQARASSTHGWRNSDLRGCPD